MSSELIEVAALNDSLREIEKLVSVLTQVERHLSAHSEMNAALHLNPKVHPSPLESLVTAAILQAENARVRLALIARGEFPLPFEAPVEAGDRS